MHGGTVSLESENPTNSPIDFLTGEYETLEDYAEDISGAVCYSCNKVYWWTGDDFHTGCKAGGDPNIPATETPEPPALPLRNH